MYAVCFNTAKMIQKLNKKKRTHKKPSDVTTVVHFRVWISSQKKLQEHFFIPFHDLQRSDRTLLPLSAPNICDTFSPVIKLHTHSDRSTAHLCTHHAASISVLMSHTCQLDGLSWQTFVPPNI